MTAGAVPGGAVSAPAWAGVRPKVKTRIPTEVKFTYLLWADVLMDPHRFLAETLHIGPLHQLQTILMLPFMLLLIFRGPVYLKNRRRGSTVWYAPLLIFISVAVLTVPLATNPGAARDQTKSLIFYYLLCMGSFIFLSTPRRLVPVISLYLFQFVWWMVNQKEGGVWWHPMLYNQDAFGALALMGVPIAFFFGMAMRPSRTRTFTMLGLSAWCMLGDIMAIARGTVLATPVVVALMWWRYPNKRRGTLAILIGAVAFVVAANVVFPGGAFWKEMTSAFTEGKSEGTGNDRWELWMASLKVWEAHPLFGAGANNFGPNAAEIIHPGEIGADYRNNPKMLYDRQLHNLYFQVLCEFGLVGTGAWIALLIDFVRKNRKLRRPSRRALWAETSGGKYDLYYVSLGLESAMLAFLLTALFYNQLYMHWFFTLVVLNIALYDCTTPAPARPAPRPGTRPVPAGPPGLLVPVPPQS